MYSHRFTLVVWTSSTQLLGIWACNHDLLIVFTTTCRSNSRYGVCSSRSWFFAHTGWVHNWCLAIRDALYFRAWGQGWFLPWWFQYFCIHSLNILAGNKYAIYIKVIHCIQFQMHNINTSILLTQINSCICSRMFFYVCYISRFILGGRRVSCTSIDDTNSRDSNRLGY